MSSRCLTRPDQFVRYIAIVVAVFSSLILGNASAETNVLFILDASGSMKEKVDGGETRMDIAKRAVSQELKDMPADVRLGLMLYGHRRAKDCKDIELVAPIASEDANTLAGIVENLQPRGETPIAASLEMAARNFASLKGQNNMIVIVTDGIEECGGDPCASASAVKARGLDIQAHIIGFTLNAAQRAAIECVAQETGGQYFEARNPAGLSEALQSVNQIAAQASPPPPPERFDLLAQRNGGEIIFASGPDWGRLNDEGLGYLYGFSTGDEGTFGFRDGQAGTFDTVAILLPGSDDRHPKEIEFFAGDEGPTGSFQSLGVMTVANGKMHDGWQEFRLPETRAKFFKAKLLSTHGGGNSVYLYELRLYGNLADPTTGEAAEDAGNVNHVDLLSPQQGGALVIGSGDDWKRLNDEGFSYLYGFAVGDEGVFEFRDGRTATIDTFAIFVPSSDDRHPREIELFAGDEGPTGAFRSIGVITVANGKMRDGWQEFKLQQTDAKFVKIRIVSNYGGNGVYLYEMRLTGELK